MPYIFSSSSTFEKSFFFSLFKNFFLYDARNEPRFLARCTGNQSSRSSSSLLPPRFFDYLHKVPPTKLILTCKNGRNGIMHVKEKKGELTFGREKFEMWKVQTCYILNYDVRAEDVNISMPRFFIFLQFGKFRREKEFDDYFWRRNSETLKIKHCEETFGEKWLIFSTIYSGIHFYQIIIYITEFEYFYIKITVFEGHNDITNFWRHSDHEMSSLVTITKTYSFYSFKFSSNVFFLTKFDFNSPKNLTYIKKFKSQNLVETPTLITCQCWKKSEPLELSFIFI